MNIEDHIIREEYSHRGGGCELDLNEFGYENEFLSAYQNYLGDGMLGSIGNSCTVEDWHKDEKLVKLAERLRDYYTDRMHEHDCIDEYNEMVEGRPVSYPGL